MGVYVVTGGSGGIGGKTVEILRSQGHEVVNVDLKDSDICANLATKAVSYTHLDVYKRQETKRGGAKSASSLLSNSTIDRLFYCYTI